MDWRVKRTIATMYDEIEQRLTVASLARRVNLSPSRFAHLFLRDTGVAPGRYLRDLRLAHARTLVEDSALTIKEVMARVGFNDPSHFARDFRRHHGDSPKRVRARARSPGPHGLLSRPSRRIRQQTGESANTAPA
jgi:AraC family transcriptional regulator of arabinose operon